MGLAAVLVASPSPTSEAPSIANRLEAARQAVEGRFLEAGEVLAHAVEGVSALVASLDRLVKTLDTGALAATTAELQAVAASLLSLPERHADRRKIIESLVGAGDRLTECIQNMRSDLDYLRVFGVYIKITAGGVTAATAEFGDFAQEICDCIESGRGQLDAFDAELKSLYRILQTALGHERSLVSQCELMLPAVPEGLSANAVAMHSHHQGIAQLAVAVSTLARDAQKKVGSALAALQVGDITRQRIEHVSHALELLQDAQGETAERHAGMTGFLHHLLAAQVRATAEDFHRDVGRIGAAMDGMAGDATEILRLSDLAFGRSAGDDKGFLGRIEHHVGQAQALVDEMNRADRQARDVGGSAAAVAVGLSARMEGLQALEADVKQMALNTRLKCSRIGEKGQPIGVIAVELRVHAGHLEVAAREALAALGQLSRDAGPLSQSDVASPVPDGASTDMRASLSGVAQDLRQLADTVEDELVSLARQGDDVAQTLRRAAGRLDFQREIGAILDEAADALAGCADDSLPNADIVEPLGELLGRVAQTYTMAREREVHQSLTADLPFPTTVVQPPPVETKADDLDDMLF